MKARFSLEFVKVGRTRRGALSFYARALNEDAETVHVNAYEAVAEYYASKVADGDEVEMLGEYGDDVQTQRGIARSFKVNRLPLAEEAARIAKEKVKAAPTASFDGLEELLKAVEGHERRGLVLSLRKEQGKRLSIQFYRREECVFLGYVVLRGRRLNNYQLKIEFVMDRLGSELVREELLKVGVGHWNVILESAATRRAYREKLEELVKLAESPVEPLFFGEEEFDARA